MPDSVQPRPLPAVRSAARDVSARDVSARGVGAREVAVVTDRPDLRALVASAAAAVPGRSVVAVPAADAAWATARFPAAVVGVDALTDLGASVRGGPAIRLAVIAGPGDDLTTVWPAALSAGADVVVADRGDGLASWLASLGGPGAGAVAVVGGRGGAGASTAAVALARAAASVGDAVLVDADPVGGGLDLALGGEGVAGLRWPDIADAPGAPAEGLLSALPVVDGIRLLAHARDRRVRVAVDAGTIGAVLGAALEGGHTVVADLPRRCDGATRAVLGRCSLLVVVVPAEVRASAAASALLDEIGGAVADVRLLVRGPSPAGLTAEDVAAAVGVPSFAEVRPEPGLAAALDRGEPVAAAGRSPLRAWATALIAGRPGASP